MGWFRDFLGDVAQLSSASLTQIIPFAITMVYVPWAHMQAVMASYYVLGTLMLRDPSELYCGKAMQSSFLSTIVLWSCEAWFFFQNRRLHVCLIH